MHRINIHVVSGVQVMHAQASKNSVREYVLGWNQYP